MREAYHMRGLHEACMLGWPKICLIRADALRQTTSNCGLVLLSAGAVLANDRPNLSPVGPLACINPFCIEAAQLFPQAGILLDTYLGWQIVSSVWHWACHDGEAPAHGGSISVNAGIWGRTRPFYSRLQDMYTVWVSGQVKSAGAALGESCI